MGRDTHWRGWSGRQQAKRLGLSLSVRAWLCPAPQQAAGHSE
ncbi:hypothetical protein GQ607_011231 [Colletotrichum asianum]|uniref:Uncharacterized protein n=1 Tax=Colletotrichum asianum TaxID=702518 RepID=A0A8H3W9C6_9PEZI|nr:hypothetical protein GQ607_011231 [Colletotrichum asianum]